MYSGVNLLLDKNWVVPRSKEYYVLVKVYYPYQKLFIFCCKNMLCINNLKLLLWRILLAECHSCISRAAAHNTYARDLNLHLSPTARKIKDVLCLCTPRHRVLRARGRWSMGCTVAADRSLSRARCCFAYLALPCLALPCLALPCLALVHIQFCHFESCSFSIVLFLFIRRLTKLGEFLPSDS